MNVPEITNQQAWSLFTSKNETRLHPSAAAAETTRDPESAITDDGAAAKGVLKLLQEGHFNGVADARLRVNFYEELHQIAGQDASGTFASGAAELSGQVLERVQALGDAYGSAEQLDTFAQTFAKAVEEASTAQSKTSTDDSLEAVRAAFASLTDSLRGVLSSIPAPKTVDTFDGTTTLDSDLDAFSTWFDDRLATLKDGMEAATLPPLSEPKGNGAAYAKFVGLYDSLIGKENGGEGAQDGDGVDVQA